MMSFKTAALAAAIGTAMLASITTADAFVIYSDETAWTAAAGGPISHTTTDPNPEYTPVDAITLSDGTMLSLTSDVIVEQIGSGWSTWSGGYTGTVYDSDGAVALAANITPVFALGFEVEPNDFNTYNITLALNDGSQFSQSVNGFGGAAFFGWVGAGVASFSIGADAASRGFAFGNFVSVTRGTPEPATLALVGAGLAGIGAFRRRKSKA